MQVPDQMLMLAAKLALSRNDDTRALAQWVLSQASKASGTQLARPHAARAVPDHVHSFGPKGDRVEPVRATGRGRR